MQAEGATIVVGDIDPTAGRSLEEIMADLTARKIEAPAVLLGNVWSI